MDFKIFENFREYFIYKCLLLLQHRPYPFALLLPRQALHGWLEEENAQDGKHDKEFYHDDYPQCASPSHVSKPFTIETPHATDDMQTFIHAANIKQIL